MKFKTGYERAIRKVFTDVKNDPDLYIAWQSNIAMAFFDNYYRDRKKSKSRIDVHKIANEAAKEFLDRMIKWKTHLRILKYGN